MSRYGDKIWQLVIVFAINFTVNNCLFTADFASYIERNFNKTTVALLERRDISAENDAAASFGGKRYPQNVLLHRPVVFVHGIGGNASDFVHHRNYFIDHGYSSDELYATTYGDPSLVDLWNMTLSCTFFRQLHEFIVAIAKYTRSKVDVVGYSGGALIARKAILGGKCADTDENIGSNLTSLVTTFVSVGGANYGVENCPSKKRLCNLLSSLNCRSKLVKELIAQKNRFEGERTYAIHSVDDHTIGTRCCGVRCASLNNAVGSFELHGIDHSAILNETLLKQFELVSTPTMSETKSAKAVRLLRSVNDSSSAEIANEATNYTENLAPEIKQKNFKTLEKSQFDPFLILCFVFIALALALFKFLSRCIRDMK